ncbi:HD domain-containing phosphohydrolase [uncultured Enterovirga sp.]|uniref:HD domain-containing phosphohydrolase n=1 Tax=uncultured Enterovirga sp. TaxID=2026352 RepID=UPI0035C9A577
MSSILKPRRSIRGKLDRLVFLSVGIALVVAGAMNVWHEADRWLASKRETLFATAHVFAAATSKAVASGDAGAVTQSLRAIGRVPGLVRAEVLDKRGAVLGEIGSAVRLGTDADLDEGREHSVMALLTSRTLQVSVPVVDGGEQVGRIVLVSDTGDLMDRFQGALLAATAASAVALALGIFLSHRLQRSITGPIVALSAAMANVERTNDYASVTTISSDDETGILASRFNGMIGEIRRATDQILAREDEIIGRLSRAAEQRDDQTGQHVVRVARISRIIAERLRLDPVYVEELCRASPMHDVGKISVPDAILFKPGRLDPDERREMERHAQAGYRVLSGSNSKLVQLAAEIALSHHERWDGQGYPNGLAGDRIPLSGRITAVGDVCDALLSVRPYKQPWSLESVKAHLIENAGTHFDPDCVDALVGCWSELELIYAETEPKHEAVAQAA